MLFTDESRFTISFHNGRNCVWRRRGVRFQDATIQEHDRYGGGSVMVWGSISLRKRNDLYRINGNLNGAQYVNEVHCTRLSTDFLRNQNVTQMNWPALSPYLNPIEHLCDELRRRIHANYPPLRNVNNLFGNRIQEWNQLPQRTIWRLVNSKRQRYQAVIAAQSGHTRY